MIYSPCDLHGIFNIIHIFYVLECFNFLWLPAKRGSCDIGMAPSSTCFFLPMSEIWIDASLHDNGSLWVQFALKFMFSRLKTCYALRIIYTVFSHQSSVIMFFWRSLSLIGSTWSSYTWLVEISFHPHLITFLCVFPCFVYVKISDYCVSRMNFWYELSSSL